MYSTDSHVFNESKKSATIQEPFDNRQFIKIHDQNNGVYQSGEIRFETSGISQTTAYSDFSRGLIYLPLVIGVYATGVDFTTAHLKESDLMLCVKNSFTTLIERMTIKCDGRNLVDQCNNINEIISYKMNTEMTANEELIWGDTLNYAIDDGMIYNDAATLSGIGYCSNNASNQVLSVTRNLEYGESLILNSGAAKRSGRFTNMTGGATRALFTDKTGNDLGNDSIENFATYKKYNVNAIIRLKDLLFFQDLPLCKGSLLQISLYVNQGSFTVLKAVTTGVLTVPTMKSSGSTNPIMFNSGWIIPEHNNTDMTQADATANDVATRITAGTHGQRAMPGGSSNLPLDKTYEVAWGIGKVSLNSGAISLLHSQQTCRLVIPQYTLSPQYEQEYLSLGKKKHLYVDYVLTTIDVGALQSINKYVTSKSRITRIIIIPKLTSAGNGNLDPSLSPFCSCPATPSPLLSGLLTNMNLEVGGVNVWRENMNYTYEQWLQEQMHSSNNGGFSNLCSGRISKSMYDNLHGVIVANIRKNDLNQNSELKVQISLTSVCKKAMSLDIFIEYQREVFIDIATGEMTDIK